MCGISGIFSPNRKIEETLHNMSALLEHRGPDNTDFFISKKFGLAHNRLSIIDLSQEANQPMQDSSGRYVITFNGEIFNFNELKKDLSKMGCLFNTNSDTEILLEGYAKEGESFFKK